MTFATIAEIYTVTRFQLEKECVYLMKKRKVLEDVIRERETTIGNLTNEVDSRDAMLVQKTLEMSTYQSINNQTLERLNTEKEEMARRLQQLESKNKELKERVGEY